MTSNPVVGKVRGDSEPTLTVLEKNERVRLKVNRVLECTKALPTAKGTGHDLVVSW